MSGFLSFFTPRRLCFVVLGLIAAAQLAMLWVEWWPWHAGLTEVVWWLVVLALIAALFAISLVCLLVAWLRRDELPDRQLLRRTTALLLLLPVLNLFFFFWFPTAERLGVAAQQGDLAAVRRCLFWGIDPDARYISAAGFGGRGESATALVAAAGSGHLDIVQTLLDAGAEIDGSNFGALRAAMHNAPSDMVRYLLERGAATDDILAKMLFYDIGKNPRGLAALAVLIEMRPQVLSTPWFLIETAHAGDQQAATLLAEVEVAERFGPVYELYRAIVLGDAPQALSLLKQIAGGMPTDLTEQQRREALGGFRLDTESLPGVLEKVNLEVLLYVAARFGIVPLVDDLLAAGAEVDPPANVDRWGLRSPLSAAVENDHLDVVNRLLLAGADVSRWDRDYGHPLYTSVQFASLPVTRRLLASGAPIDAPASATREQTALMAAVRFGKLQQAQLLVASGADLTVKRDGYFTACDEVQSGDEALAEFVASLDCGPR